MRAVAAAAALLGGCGAGGGDEAVPLNDQQFAEAIENIAEARPEPEAGPPGPNLVRVSPADVERALPPGAGCDFSDEGKLLFAVAASGEALARVNGLPVRLQAEAAVGANGGFFATPRYRVSIAPLSRDGIEIGESTTWPARLVLTDRRSGEKTNELRMEGTWRCDA
ncbi:MAG TPA: hypothetical protein VGB79_16060 [Allosphingosinicella sp.]